MNTQVNNTPKMIITAGLPGAGKSTYLRKVGLDSMKIVDSDEVKKLHPNYDPKAPELVHEWSKIEARKIHLGYLSKGESFIVDGTGTNVERYLQYINEAKELGYEVELHYVKVSVQTSLERNASRERTVPVSIIYEKAGVIEQSVYAIGLSCDKVVTYKND